MALGTLRTAFDGWGVFMPFALELAFLCLLWVAAAHW